jgi:TonB-linked SusC/RagA family outer membrane protein
MKYKNIKKAVCLSIASMGILASPGIYLFALPNNISFSTALQDSLYTDSTELVQVAFRKVKKKDVMGEVSAININNLLNKNYTTYSLDNLDAFIPGYNGNIWGTGGYLLLVDGFPRDANNVMPTEIEEISVMKGINAVALYGSRASKGVIYITTKRGQDDGQTINIRSNAGINTPISYPKYLGSAEYMTLYNEARRNDGLPNLYSDETIYHHSAGLNPYRYPNVDYYSSDYIKNSYNRYDATAEVSGGGDKTKYYTNFGFWSAGSLLNFGEAIGNTSNRFNMRGNIDAKLNSIMSLNVDASASFYTQKGVNTDYWSAASTGRPHRFSPLIPISMLEEADENSWTYVNTTNFLVNGQYLLGGSQLDQSNAFATIYSGGSSRYMDRQFQFNTGLDFDLKSIAEGLTFQTALAIDYQNQYNQSYNNTYAVYQAAWNNYNGEDLISSLTKYGEDRRNGIQNISGSIYRQTIGMNARLNYFRTYNDNHHVSAILLANAFQITRSAEYHKQSNANLGLHLGYNFANKYYADFSAALPHSAKLPESKRKAISPTLSLAWRLSEEEFMKGGVFNDLRLKAAAGIVNTDLDIEQYYMYQGYYTYNDGAWYSWADGQLVHSFDRIRGDNKNMHYPQRREYSFGFEASMFNNLISYNATYFYNQMNGLLVQANTIYPMYFMSYWPVYSDLPYVNYNIDERRGVDFGLNINKKFNDISSLSLGVNGMYYSTQASQRDELYEFAYQNRTGKPLDAIWGLQHNGFYGDQSDIDNSPTSSFGEVKPGDIKYIDQNGDGIIDNRDEIYLGKGGWAGAPFSLGFNITAKWKNLTFFAVATGRYGANALRNNSYFWVDGEDKYSETVRNRWTPETSSTATYPRLTTTNSDNNFRGSDFWVYSTNRFDLSKIQLSYDFPKSILGNGILRELGTYVNGFNLMTFSKERETMQLSVGSAPQTRFFNFGVKALF